ncbi:unnamed protein product, partial [Vitrella brassicaformis CCMP3155]
MTEPNGAGGSGAVVRPAFCTLGNPVDASTNLFSLKVDESVKIQVYAVNITPPITNVSEVRKVIYNAQEPILNALVADGAKVGAILHQGMNLFVTLPHSLTPNQTVSVDSTIQGNSQTFSIQLAFKHDLVLRGGDLEQEAIQYMNV